MQQTVSYPLAVRSAEGLLSLSAQVSSKRVKMAFSSIQLSLLSWLNAAERIAMCTAYYATPEVEP